MVLRRPPRIASRAGFPAGPSLCLHTPLTGSSPLPRCPSSRAVLCSHTKTTASPPPERPPGPAVPRGLGLAAPPFLPALLPGHPVAESFWVGSCGLRPPPSWKPQWQRGEKGRGEGRLGQESTPTWGLGAESGSPNARCCSPASLSCCWACLWPPWLFIPTSGPTLLPSAVRPWRGTPTRPCTTGGFLCFALVFCALLQVVFWRFYNPTQVEDAVLDTYDLVYEQAVRSPSSVWRQELAAIQDTDCLQGVRSFLKTHLSIVTALVGLGLAFTVYVMLLSSFLWAAIRSGRSLDHRGTYTPTPRARGRRPQEPSLSRYSQRDPALQHPYEMQALDDRLGGRGLADGPGLCQHSRASASRPVLPPVCPQMCSFCDQQHSSEVLAL
ncbi:tetraspanin-32 isoform 2-T3 [Trichechus inunguis]